MLTLRSLGRTLGKTINEVGEKHQRRKLKELKTNVEKALWFTETFGLSFNSVTFSGKDGPKRFPMKNPQKNPLKICRKKRRIN